MAFTINTNIASLQAQDYLNQTQTFQNQTINEVTSGLRIVNSGDDPSGLAIANSYRSNEAVLTQGIANANDGLSQLQIADGGISNISQLLDSARSLATEAASDTFTGDRGVLNSQFQSVLTEINRQAQAIGLNQGGTFAKALNVFIGGGEASGTTTATQNGTVSVNLAQSTVDSKSLGLEGVVATGVNSAGTTDLGPGSATNVQAIVTNTTNLASITNNTTNFIFTGPGFTSADGGSKVDVAVNLAGVTDTNTLVTAINQALQNAGNGSTQQDTAFANADITASISTNAAGQQTLAFSSATTAFQVQGADQVSTALLGNFSSGAIGNVANVTAAAGQAFAAPAAAESVQLRINGMGLNGAANDLTVALATTDTATTAVGKINAAITANTTVAATGIKAVDNAGTIDFVNGAGNSFTVQTAGDVSNALGFGSWANSTGLAATAGTFNYTSLTAVGAGSATTENLQVSLNGGAATADLGPLTGSATEATNLATLNAAFQGNAATRAAGLTAIDNAGNVEITSSAGENFRLNFYGGTGDAFGFGAAAVGSGLSTNGSISNYAAPDSINSAGAQQSVNSSGNTDVYQFTPVLNSTDSQTVTLSAVDANGTQHTLNIALNSSNAGNLDQAISTINSDILSSDDSTLQQLVAVKQENAAGTAEGIRFLDAGGSFNVSLGASPNNVGIADGGTGTNGGAILASASNGAGSTANISNTASAEAAVNALGTAVSKLGDAQAEVGIGENNFTYAVNLAQSQLTNFQAAESQIRDSDLAVESANLTKSQIQLQAGVAALAQANSAPQQVLSLLQHP